MKRKYRTGIVVQFDFNAASMSGQAGACPESIEGCPPSELSGILSCEVAAKRQSPYNPGKKFQPVTIRIPCGWTCMKNS